jgi:D-alanyl-D-alanine-carboxypeptidase/D-alanyl-D-alanine-endopeptidase
MKLMKIFMIIILFVTSTFVTMGLERSKLENMIEMRIGRQKGCAAIGIISKNSVATVFHGGANGKTVFELCSLTKIFTALLLADMVEKGEVKLEDPINKFIKTNNEIGNDVTLLHLATHTSGLPSSPTDFTMEYTKEQMDHFLTRYSLPGRVGKMFAYSNLGFGLLGHILSSHAEISYERLVKDRICGPIQMETTGIEITQDPSTRCAVGYDQDGNPVPTRKLPRAYLSAGALRSTLNDMLKFLNVNMHPEGLSIGKAIRLTQKPYYPSTIPDTKAGLAWCITSTDVSSIIWHEGIIKNHYAFIGFDPQHNRGVVILAGSGISMTDIGLHLLDDRYPVSEINMNQRGVELDDSALNQFVGQYQVNPDYVIAILKENGHLFCQAPGMPKLEITPISTTVFLVKKIGIKLIFVKDREGQVTSMEVNQGNTKVMATKLSYGHLGTVLDSVTLRSGLSGETATIV